MTRPAYLEQMDFNLSEDTTTLLGTYKRSGWWRQSYPLVRPGFHEDLKCVHSDSRFRDATGCHNSFLLSQVTGASCQAA